MSVTVRRATKDDARRVAQMAVSLVDQHREYDTLRFARLYDAEDAEWFYGERSELGDSAIFVAESDNQIVGMAFLEFQPVGYGQMIENSVWLQDIFVEPEIRGTGAGELLMNAATEWAKSVNAGKMMLSVAAVNAIGQGFFERRGFRPTMIEMMLPIDGADVNQSGSRQA